VGMAGRMRDVNFIAEKFAWRDALSKADKPLWLVAQIRNYVSPTRRKSR
jgi:hypothetical protein